MVIYNIRLSAIPTLHIPSLLPSINGTIVLYHGYASSKDRLQILGEIFAMKGYEVYIPDLPRHGERGQLIAYDPASRITNFWPVILEAVNEGRAFLQEIVEHSKDPIQNLFLIGESMGGFIVPAICSQSDYVSGAISINGSCSWVESEKIFRDMDGRLPLTVQETQKLSLENPLETFQNELKPLLIIHGISDQFVPIEGQDHFFSTMKEKYTNPSSMITYMRLPNINHTISYGMIEKMLNWLHHQN